MKSVRNERGIALAMAIFALVVIGALVAGSFFIGMQEQRVGRNTITYQQAFTAAEEGASQQVSAWSPGALNQIPIGDSVLFAGTLPSNGGWYRGSTRRLSDLNYLVRSEGFSRDSASRQQVGMLVRLRPVEFDVTAALKTQGALKIGGSTQINGNDQFPPGWTGCPALKPALPGIQLPDITQISTSGCTDMSCVTGNPPVEEDPSITVGDLTTFGDASFDELKSMANKFVGPGTRKVEPTLNGTQCNKTDENNWGDPLNPTAPCGDYFPIIWVEGDAHINGVQGQGVLIVNGNLEVQGGFVFYGPVIVRQTVNTQGTGGHFNGGVIAANVSFDQSTVLGDAVVNFSSCAIIKALKNSAPGALFQERSWVNLN
jgi:hypothetical protein